MPPVLAFRPLSTPDTSADAGDRALCPHCHTADASLTMTAVMAGAAWRCAVCAQRWDLDRLATVASYDAWVAVSPSIERAGEMKVNL
jgi:transcription elongation factor Elf1